MSYQKHNFEPGAVLFASQLNDMDNQIEVLSNQESTLSENFKVALLNCFENVAWVNQNGQSYYNELYNALYPDIFWTVTNILSDCTNSNNAINVLKNSSYVATITANQGYTLDGATVSILMGGNDVTNLYYSSGSINIPNVTGDLVITVTAISAVTSITAVFTQGSAVIYDTYLLDALRQYLVVTANYSDSTTATVADYTLSGTLEVGTSIITASYGGKSATFSVTVSSRIPSTYKQVEYIESHGNQAITTDIIPRNTRTIVTFEFTQFVGSESGSGLDNFVTGVYNSNNMRYLPCYLDQRNQFTFKSRDNSYQWRGPYSPAGKHTVDFNNASHQAKYDGVVHATNALFEITSGDNKLAIFARGHSSAASYSTTYGYARVYSLRYEDNDTGNAVGEFIPCYRKADGVIGMYDLVSETFYENVNSGEPFTKGSDAWETGE